MGLRASLHLVAESGTQAQQLVDECAYLVAREGRSVEDQDKPEMGHLRRVSIGRALSKGKRMPTVNVEASPSMGPNSRMSPSEALYGNSSPASSMDSPAAIATTSTHAPPAIASDTSTHITSTSSIPSATPFTPILAATRTISAPHAGTLTRRPTLLALSAREMDTCMAHGRVFARYVERDADVMRESIILSYDAASISLDWHTVGSTRTRDASHTISLSDITSITLSKQTACLQAMVAMDAPAAQCFAISTHNMTLELCAESMESASGKEMWLLRVTGEDGVNGVARMLPSHNHALCCFLRS